MKTEPTFADGYPTDETLETIREWPVETSADFAAVMDFAGRAWHWPYLWKCEPNWIDPDWPSNPPQRVYRFSTGGWSGNESIVEAIKANLMAQAIGAYSWRRGGHYEYRFPVAGDES